ncbi:thioredoxin reductase-like selenoprotein T homolog CG3887 [Microplitis mediator]|uniref:thioredoxin reductase-like selenoprotein T homolog CG3887 n=1 Tax=Microplitis demolitor TaxID=69319 RepID=UPI0004CD8948|nr:thioredoxin reductase-like selenoprotein T homolog CG3887 [Microplitis demolitor]XP_057326694.1 thioredoxin reductase-like selenoprotein T homolog CG3887 [Microplitis mediator]
MRSLKISLWFIAIICTLSIGFVVAEDDEITLSKFGSKAGPTIKFLYCYSCGYKRVYEEYVNILRQKYPELHIHGQNYDPPGYNMFMAKFLGFAKILIILLIISGINIAQWLGQPPLFWWDWCLNNKLYACIMIFFICNAIEGQLISSGAFEIHFNDVPVWSKLETGRVPQPPELFQIIDNQLQMLFPERDSLDMSFNK